MITIDVERFEAFIFDLDGVITQTALGPRTRLEATI